jgi:TorA maturation chaperone TorD
VLPARGPGTGKDAALHFASLYLEKDNINEGNGAR